MPRVRKRPAAAAASVTALDQLQPAAPLATAAASVPARSKIRVSLAGARVWIKPESEATFMEAAKLLHSERKWTQKAWSRYLRNEVKTNWDGSTWGGQRGGGNRLHETAASGAAVRRQPAAPQQDLEESQPLTMEVVNPVSAVLALSTVPLDELQFGDKIGEGSFGKVWTCSWGERNLVVKICYMQVSRTSPEREISLLQHLGTCGRHDSIIDLLDWRRCGSTRVFLFFPRCECDLKYFILSERRLSRPIPVPLVMHFAISLCSAAAHLQRCEVLHRDLKPANILLQKKCTPWLPVLCDFGNSRCMRLHPTSDSQRRQGDGSSHEMGSEGMYLDLTGDVTTLWYAAPEALIPEEPYGFSVDIWSLGLILAELESKCHICPASDDANAQQLLQFWWMSKKLSACASPQPAAPRENSFALRMRIELQHHFTRARINTPESDAAVGHSYGLGFRAYVFRLLALDPLERVRAAELHAEGVAFKSAHASLPITWTLGNSD